MEAVKKALKSKKVLVGLVIFITLLIAVLIYFVTAIYTKNKPAFVPEETRGEVREGVRDVVVRPLEKVAPSVAKKIEDAAYQAPVSSATNSSESGNSYKNWQTYKNEELGFELKYPDGWRFAEQESRILGDGAKAYFSIDPNYSEKEKAQIFLEINNNDLMRVEDRALADLFVTEKNNYMVDGVQGVLYRANILSFETGEEVGEAYEWIGSSGDSVFVVSYTTNRQDRRDLYNDYKTILDSISFN